MACNQYQWMKKFKVYALIPSTDTSVIGNWPQLELREQADNSQNNKIDISEENFLESSPDLSNFIFKNGVKRTDVLSSEYLDLSKGLFVSDKFCEMLEDVSFKHFSFYPAALSNDGMNKKYYFLHLLYNFATYVDKDKSDFFHLIKKTSIKLNENDNRLPPMGRVRSLVLNKDPKIFRLPSLTEIFISEAFKTTLIQNNITGFELEEFDYYDIFLE